MIVAHCASFGKGVDLDAGPSGPTLSNFALFTRLMEEPRYVPLLRGDISSLVQRNRASVALSTLLSRQDWHGRLLFGSDYPLTGVMPLISVHALADMGLLDPREVPTIIEIRRHNPLLFDFVLKRRLVVGGRRFATGVFETRGYFT